MSNGNPRDPRKALILAAVLFGLLSACLSFVYLRSQRASAEPSPTTPVVFAKQDIPARSSVTADMLEVRQVTAIARHPGAYSELTSVVGRVPKYPIAKDEQVIVDRLASEKTDSGIASQIPAGRRAVAVGINEVVGTGNLVVPGDHVDVIAVFDEQKSGKKAAVVVLQNIEVLAVGQVVEAVKKSAPEEKSGSANQAAYVNQGPKSATLAVTLDEAQRLVLAEEFGKLRLAVRPAKDTAIAQISERPLSAVVSEEKGGR